MSCIFETAIYIIGGGQDSTVLMSTVLSEECYYLMNIELSLK